MKQLSSLAVRLGALVVACGVYVAVSDVIGLAQQAPPPGAAPAQGAPGAPGAAGQGRRGGGGGGGGRGPAPLGDGPWEYGQYRVTVVTKNVVRPWGIAFLPNGDLLVTERNSLKAGDPGQLRVIRNGVLDPTPIGPLPAMLAEGLGGMMDVSLHPQFAQNRLIYFAYSKRHPDPKLCMPEAERQKLPNNQRPACLATAAVARARWDGGSTLADVKDILVADAWYGGPAGSTPADPRCGRGATGDDNAKIGFGCSVGPATGSYGVRLAWDKAGLLYVSLGDRNIPNVSQDPATHAGKILRIRDDGTVPPDNPFVKRQGWKPEIYSYGHRNPLGLWYRESTGELWSTEEGPQGGDELNLIKAGKNYGWPLAGLGRNYDGSIIGKGFSGADIEDPLVFWVPAIAISGLSIYDGDKLPGFRGQAFVGAMRNGTGQFVARVTLNGRGQPTGRDHSMLADLRQRIREVKPGPDGLIYVLTDENAGAVLRIEPNAAAAPAK
ncbi:MAG TPA: PQQ-dependent sugar dehydrogenase [Vicinamibacterales bacterium]|nr:PQQ-dependent sugar dehydrogenase [Vicinamibacterales bacterium]